MDVTQVKKDPRLKAREQEFRASIRHLPTKEQQEVLAQWRKEQTQGSTPTPQPAQPPQEPPGPPRPPTTGTDSDGPAYMPHGPLTRVQCDVKGWEKVVVSYDLSAKWDAIFGPTKDDDNWGYERKCMELCPLIEWNYLNSMTGEMYPNSVAPNLESYYILGRRAVDVALWLLRDGLRKAEKEALSPNS